MGISLEEWVAYVRAHPLKMKYRGLNGYYTSVGEAATHDERFMDRYMEQEWDYFEKNADDEYAEEYAEHLRRQAGVDLEDLDLSDAQVIAKYDAPEHRADWAREYRTAEECWEIIKNDNEHLLTKHPPEKIWSYAYDEGLDVEKVWFICPSCRTEPFTKFDFEQYGNSYFYCGNCGASSATGDDPELKEFIAALEIKEWPLKDLELTTNEEEE